jgi:hypothetical protein
MPRYGYLRWQSGAASINPTFAAYSTITTVVVYETEDSDLAVGPEVDGAAKRIRTPDPRITNALLYQLSYCGMPRKGRAF